MAKVFTTLLLYFMPFAVEHTFWLEFFLCLLENNKVCFECIVV